MFVALKVNAYMWVYSIKHAEFTIDTSVHIASKLKPLVQRTVAMDTSSRSIWKYSQGYPTRKWRMEWK